MKFRQHPAVKAPKPGKVVKLEPSCFDPTWKKAPQSAIALGLRGISDGDESTARAEAEKVARAEYKHQDPDNYQDCFNDLVMRWIVARGICDPNDSTKPHPLFTMAESSVRKGLTSSAVLWLFEELERLHLETGPLHPEATDDDVAKLIDALYGGEALNALPDSQARCLRKLLRYVLDELDTAAQPTATH